MTFILVIAGLTRQSIETMRRAKVRRFLFQ